jgi:hypothetical protein
MRKTILFSVFTSLFVAAANAAPVLSFDGAGGALTVTAGGTVGWGFTLTDSAEFLVVAETAFCPATAVQGDLPAGCAAAFATLGTYTDFAGNIPVVGPAPDTSPLTQNFNSGTLSGGFGMFAVVPAATAGTTNGEIAVVYDLFTGDPNTNPNATQIGGDTFAALPASITVGGQAAAAPEPGSVLLVGLGLTGVLLKRRLKRAINKP